MESLTINNLKIFFDRNFQKENLRKQILPGDNFWPSENNSTNYVCWPWPLIFHPFMLKGFYPLENSMFIATLKPFKVFTFQKLLSHQKSPQKKTSHFINLSKLNWFIASNKKTKSFIIKTKFVTFFFIFVFSQTKITK